MAALVFTNITHGYVKLNRESLLQKSKFKRLFSISNRYKLNFKRPSGMLLSNY